MANAQNEMKKNGSGYSDPTAYEALKHITKMEEKRWNSIEEISWKLKQKMEI